MDKVKSNTDIKMFVSVIIPVYNVDSYLHECISSILNQTFTQYEIILIDDGSTDKSGEICDFYASKYNFVRTIHQENQGQAAARNFGVEKAKYDWIVFVDSDDVAHPQMIEYLIRAQIETSALICSCKRVEGEGVTDSFANSRTFHHKKYCINEESLNQLHEIGSSYYWALFPSLISKKLYQAHKMPVGRIYEDNAICCQWLYAAGVFAEVPEKLYFYRKNPTSTMNKKFTEKQLDYLWALKEQISFFSEIGYDKMLNVAFDDYVEASIGMYNKVGDELENQILQKNILQEAISYCKKNNTRLEKFDSYIDRLEKRLHPTLHRVKKRIRTLFG